MTIEFDLDQLSDKGRSFLLKRSNEWRCTPSEAFVRIVETLEKRDRRKTKDSEPETNGKHAA